MAPREFVTSIISEWFLEAANHTCGPYDADIDEMKLANLTPIPSERVSVRVAYHNVMMSLPATILCRQAALPGHRLL